MNSDVVELGEASNASPRAPRNELPYVAPANSHDLPIVGKASETPVREGSMPRGLSASSIHMDHHGSANTIATSCSSVRISGVGQESIPAALKHQNQNQKHLPSIVELGGTGDDNNAFRKSEQFCLFLDDALIDLRNRILEVLDWQFPGYARGVRSRIPNPNHFPFTSARSFVPSDGVSSQQTPGLMGSQVSEGGFFSPLMSSISNSRGLAKSTGMESTGMFSQGGKSDRSQHYFSDRGERSEHGHVYISGGHQYTRVGPHMSMGHHASIGRHTNFQPFTSEKSDAGVRRLHSTESHKSLVTNNLIIPELRTPSQNDSYQSKVYFQEVDTSQFSVERRGSALEQQQAHVHDVWAGYMHLLRSNAGNAQIEYQGAKSKVCSQRHALSVHKSGSTVENLLAVFVADKFIIHPNSWPRKIWLVFSFVMLVYDSVMLPINAFFDFGGEEFPMFNVMMYIALVFWVLDIVLNFRTGKNDHGAIEMRLALIAKIYAKTWLSFDLVLVFSDWVLAIVWLCVGEGDFDNLGVATPTIRYMRLFRLLRLMKLQTMLEETLAINDKRVIAISGTIKVTLVYAIYCHFLACVWYGVGRMDNHGWAHDCHARFSQDVTVAFCYFSAAHWSFEHLSGSANMVHATALEWAFATATSFVGVILFAYFLCLMMHAIGKERGFDKVEMRIRGVAYAENHRLSTGLSHRLLRYIDSCDIQVDLRKRLRQEHEMLFHLPVALQMEVLEEARKPFLTTSPIVFYLEMVSAKMVRQLCSEATTASTCLSGEHVFTRGDQGSHWRLVEFGHVAYVSAHDEPGGGSSHNLTPPSELRQRSPFAYQASTMSNSFESSLSLSSRQSFISFSEGKYIRTLEEGASISEMVLFTPWVHSGELIATSDCVLLQLSLEAFMLVLKVRTDTCYLVAMYAQQYVKHMNSLDYDVTDLFLYRPTTQDLPDADASNGSASVHYKVFLSHYKAEAGTEATLMQEALNLLLVRESVESAESEQPLVFLDSEDLTDLSDLKQCVIKSENLVLLLTPGVLLRPWCLVEIVTAMNNGVQIVPVEIERPGIRFTYPDEKFYSKLRKGEALSKQDARLLDGEGISLEDVEEALRCVFKQIALPFSPHKSKNIREAELVDILKRCMHSSVSTITGALEPKKSFRSIAPMDFRRGDASPHSGTNTNFVSSELSTAKSSSGPHSLMTPQEGSA